MCFGLVNNLAITCTAQSGSTEDLLLEQSTSIMFIPLEAEHSLRVTQKIPHSSAKRSLYVLFLLNNSIKEIQILEEYGNAVSVRNIAVRRTENKSL